MKLPIKVDQITKLATVTKYGITCLWSVSKPCKCDDIDIPMQLTILLGEGIILHAHPKNSIFVGCVSMQEW